MALDGPVATLIELTVVEVELNVNVSAAACSVLPNQTSPGYLAVGICIVFAIWLWRTGQRGTPARYLALLFALYPAFLGKALRTRWTSAFARIPARVGLALGAVALLSYTFGHFVSWGTPDAIIIYFDRIWIL